MRIPPARPTRLSPRGASITLPKPILLIGTREQAPYDFAPFRRWFASIERRPLRTGDFSMAGLEGQIAVERKSLRDLFNSCSPCGSRQAFIHTCARLGKLEFSAAVVEASLDGVLDGAEWSGMHPNAVLGTLQAIAIRWGVHS